MAASNTGQKQAGTFTKGDPRINRKGRPKSFDAWRALALEIAHEPAQSKDPKTGELRPVVIDGHVATNAELLIRKWFASGDPRLQMYAAEVAFGKVPQPVDLAGKGGGPVELRVVYDDKLQDSSAETAPETK